MEAKGVLKDMRRATRAILREVAPSADDVQTPAAYVHTQRHIVRQVDEVLSHQESLADAEDHQGHHAMRIAAKRLRYTLEIARPVYPGKLEEGVEAIKKVQSLLGEIHDCDVWEAHLNAFAAKQRDRIMTLFGNAGRLIRLQAGIEYLRADRRRHCQDVFRQLVDYWAELGRRQFWAGLKVLTQSYDHAPAAAQPPAAQLPAATAPATSTSEAAARHNGNGNGNAHHAADQSPLTTGS